MVQRLVQHQTEEEHRNQFHTVQILTRISERTVHQLRSQTE